MSEPGDDLFRTGLRGSCNTGAEPEEPMVYTADGSPYQPQPAPVYGPTQPRQWLLEYHHAPRLVLGDPRFVIVQRFDDDGDAYYQIGYESPDYHDGLWEQEYEQGVTMTEAQLRAALAWIEQQKRRETAG